MPEVANVRLGENSASFLRAARAGNVTELVELLKSGTDINTCNANGLNALHIASKEGHADVVEELLTRGARVDAATKKGNTALHIASLAGQMEVVELLINHGANPNVQSQDGFTPLYMAAQENHDGVVVYLLQHGANQSLATEEGFTPLAVALQQGHDRVVAILLENDTRGKVRLPALHIAAKKDDTKAAALLLQSDHNPDVTSKSGFTPLHIAAHYGNENIAKMLLEKGANVNFMARHNITPLHVAAKWGRANLVALLLAHGAVIDCRTRDLLTPLHCAARSGHDQIVDLLLEKGAPISAKSKNGLAPLHTAAQGDHVDTARILLYHRAPVDEVTVDYLTPLHIAAHYGHVQTAKLLLDRNADPNSRALNGFTPLHVACKKNRIKVVELLLKYQAALEATTESGLTPLHVAAFMGCMNIVVYLMQHGANPDVVTIRGETPLHLATRAYQTDVVRILLRNGATVDATAREGQTPLHIASRLGNADIVMLLLQHGAKVDAPTRDQYTPLHIAAKEGQEEVVALLLDHGASHELQTSKGFKPIHLAAKYGNYAVVEALLEKGADVDAQGKNQVTPLHVAAHYNHEKVALLLLEHKASPRAAAKNGYTPLHIVAKKNQLDIAPVLLEYQADVNAESKAGFTPLHLASQEGHVGMVLFLLEHGAEVNAQARNGLTPMHLCAQDDRVEVAQVLKDHGANLSPQTKAGYTPLHVACHFGQINMVKFLLENGADLNASTSLGYTPLHQAAQQGHGIIVKLLLDEGASPNVLTTNGQTPLSIAQKLGYVSVVETLRTITETTIVTETTTITEERYNVQSPETMQETFISESEDEGDDAYARSLERDLDGLSSLRPFSDLSDVYLNGTSQFMDTSGFGSLRRHSPSSRSSDFYSSLPRRQHHHRPGDGIGKLRYAEEGGVASSLSFEKEMHHPIEALQDESLLPMDKSLEAEQLQLENLIRKVQEQPFTPSGSDYRLEDAFSPDNVDTSRLALHSGFLVSFLVDARGGAMRGCRHSGVRIIVPPRKAPMPMRITCRYLRREKLIHPPPLNEGEALASRILEMGPAGAKFLGPVIIEVPHFASLRGREREIVLMRSEDGEHWKEHALEATEDAVQEVLNESFNPEELSQIEDLNTTRITRILTNDFPQYFALVTRIRQEVHAVGPEGGMIASTVVPQVQALFPEGALTKTIKVSLQAQAIPQDLVNKLHGNRVAVSPIVTVEPRRRKFHKPITLCIPLPQSTNKGMITQYSAQTGQDPPTLRLLCSIVGGTAPAQWEDITGTTQLTFSNDNVSFTTTVSARFWLMDCQTPRESARMAQEIYNDGIVVPYMAKFVVFARRLHPTEGQLRLFCVTDDKEDKTLERQEHYQEIAKSRDVEVLSGRPQYLEFVGNLVPVTKSGEQLSMHFFPFQENRLMFYLKLRDLDDPNAAAAGRVAVMRESRQRSENLPPQHPICTLAITLPNYSGTPPSDAYLIEGRKEVPPSEKAPVYESSWESRRTFTPNYVHYQSTPKVPSVESTYIAPYTQAIAQEEVAPIRPERHVSNILPVKEETNVSQEYVLLKTSDNLEDAEPYLYESPVVERKGVEIVEEPTASPIISEPASSEVGFAFEPQRESLESSLASSEQSSDTIVAPPRDKGARLASKTARLSYKEGSSSEASTLSARSPTAPDEISSEWTADQLSPFVQSLSYEESNLADVQENETAIGRVDLQVNLKRSADNAVMSGTIPDAALVTRGVAEVRRMRGDKFPPSEEVPSSELRYDEEDGKWTAETSYGAVETKTMGDDWRLSPGSEKQVTLNVRLRRGEDQFNSVAIIPEGSRVAPTATDVQRRTGEVNELRLEELEASKVPLERRLVEEVGDKDRRDAVEGPVGDSSVRLVPLDRSSASDSSFVPLQDELEASVLEVSGLSLEDDEIDPSAVPLRRSLTPRAGEEPMGGYHLVGERRVPANGIICHASSEDLSSQQTAPSAQPLLLDSPLLYSGEPKLVELPDESCVERSVHVDQPTLGPWSGDRVRKEEDISYEEKNRQELWTRSPNALVMGTYLGQPVVAGLVSSPVEVECIEGGHLLLTGDTPFVKLHLDRDLSEKAKVGSVPKDSDVIVRECQEYLALLDEGQTTPSPGSRVQPSPVVGGLFLGSPVVQSTFTVVDDRGAPLRSLQDLPDVKTSQETETVEEGFIEGDGRVVSTKKITRVVTTTRTMTTGNDGPKVQETRVTTQQVMDGSGRPVVVEEIVSSPGPSSGGVAPNEPPRQQPLIRLKVDDAVFNGVLDKNAHIKLTPAEAGEGGGGGGESLNAAASYRPSIVGSAEQLRGVLEREFLPPSASIVKNDELPLKLQEMSPVEEHPPHEWQPSQTEDESLPVPAPEEPVSVRERIRRFEGFAIERIGSLFGRRRAGEEDQLVESRRATVTDSESVPPYSSVTTERSISRSFTLASSEPVAEASAQLRDLLAVQKAPCPDTELLSHLSEKSVSSPELPVRLSFAEHSVIIPEVSMAEEQSLAVDVESTEYLTETPELVLPLCLEPDGLGEWLGTEEQLMLPIIHTLLFTEPNLSDEFIVEQVESVSPVELQFSVVEPASFEDVTDRLPISDRSSEVMHLSKLTSPAMSADSELYDYEVVTAESPSVSPSKDDTRFSFISKADYHPEEVVERAELPSEGIVTSPVRPTFEPSLPTGELPEGILSIDRSGLTTESKLFKSVMHARFDGTLPDERIEVHEQQASVEGQPPTEPPEEIVERSFTKMQLPQRFECDFVIPEVFDLKKQFSADSLAAVVTSVEANLHTGISLPEQIGSADQLLYKTESKVRLVDAQPIGVCSHEVAAEFCPLSAQHEEAFIVHPHAEDLVSGLLNVRDVSVTGIAPPLIVQEGKGESAELVIPKVSVSRLSTCTTIPVMPSSVTVPEEETSRFAAAQEILTEEPFQYDVSEVSVPPMSLLFNKAEEVEQADYAVQRPHSLAVTSDFPPVSLKSLQEPPTEVHEVITPEEEVRLAVEVEPPLTSGEIDVKTTLRGIPKEQTWFVAQIEPEDKVPVRPSSLSYAVRTDEVSDSQMLEVTKSISIGRAEEHEITSAILSGENVEEEIAFPATVETAVTSVELQLENSLAKEGHVNLAFELDAGDRFASEGKQFEKFESVVMTSSPYEIPSPQEFVTGLEPEFDKEESISMEQSFSAYSPADVRDRREVVSFKCERSIPVQGTALQPSLAISDVSLALSKYEDSELGAVAIVDESEYLIATKRTQRPSSAYSEEYSDKLTSPITSELPVTVSELDTLPAAELERPEPVDSAFPGSDVFDRGSEYRTLTEIESLVEHAERTGEMFEVAEESSELYPPYKGPTLPVESSVDHVVEFVKQPILEESPVLAYPVVGKDETLIQEGSIITELSTAVQEAWVTLSKKQSSQTASVVIDEVERSVTESEAPFQSITELDVFAELPAFSQLEISESAKLEPSDSSLEQLTVETAPYVSDEMEESHKRVDELKQWVPELAEQSESPELSVLAPLSPGLVEAVKEGQPVSVEEGTLVGRESALMTDGTEVASPVESANIVSEQPAYELQQELGDDKMISLEPSSLAYSLPGLEDEGSSITRAYEISASPTMEPLEKDLVLDKSLELFKKESSEVAAVVLGETTCSSATCSVPAQTVVESEYHVDVQAFASDQSPAVRTPELYLQSGDFASAEISFEDSLLGRSQLGDIGKDYERLEPYSLFDAEAAIADRETEPIVLPEEEIFAEQIAMERDLRRVSKMSPSPPAISPTVEVLPDEDILQSKLADEAAAPSLLLYSATGLQDKTDEVTLEAEHGIAESITVQDSYLAFSKEVLSEHASAVIQDTEGMMVTAVMTAGAVAGERIHEEVPSGEPTVVSELPIVLPSEIPTGYETTEIAMLESSRDVRTLSPGKEMTELGREEPLEPEEVGTLKAHSLFPIEAGLTDESPEIPLSIGKIPKSEEEIVPSVLILASFTRLESVASATLILGDTVVSGLTSLVSFPLRSFEFEEDKTRSPYDESVEVALPVGKVIDEQAYIREPPLLRYSPTGLEEVVMHEPPLMPEDVCSVPTGDDFEYQSAEERTEEVQVIDVHSVAETKAAALVGEAPEVEESISIEPSFLAYSIPGVIEKEVVEPVLAPMVQMAIGEDYNVEQYISTMPARMAAEKKEESGEATALIGHDERTSLLSNIVVASADSALSSFSPHELEADGSLERMKDLSAEVELGLPPTVDRAIPFSVDETSKVFSILSTTDASTQGIAEMVVGREPSVEIETVRGQFEPFSQAGLFSEKPPDEQFTWTPQESEPKLTWLSYSSPGIEDVQPKIPLSSEESFAELDLTFAKSQEFEQAKFIASEKGATVGIVAREPSVKIETVRGDFEAFSQAGLFSEKPLDEQFVWTYEETQPKPTSLSYSSPGVQDIQPEVALTSEEFSAEPDLTFVKSQEFEQAKFVVSEKGTAVDALDVVRRKPSVEVEKAGGEFEPFSQAGLFSEKPFDEQLTWTSEESQRMPASLSYSSPGIEDVQPEVTLISEGFSAELDLTFVKSREFGQANFVISEKGTAVDALDVRRKRSVEIETVGDEFEPFSQAGLFSEKPLDEQFIWTYEESQPKPTSLSYSPPGVEDVQPEVPLSSEEFSAEQDLTFVKSQEFEQTRFVVSEKEAAVDALDVVRRKPSVEIETVGGEFEPFSQAGLFSEKPLDEQFTWTSEESQPKPTSLSYSPPGIEDVQPEVRLTSEEFSAELDLTFVKSQEFEQARLVVSEKGAAVDALDVVRRKPSVEIETVGDEFEPFSEAGLFSEKPFDEQLTWTSVESQPKPTSLSYSPPGIEDVQPEVPLSSEEFSAEQDLTFVKSQELEQTKFVVSEKGAAAFRAHVVGTILPVALSDSAALPIKEELGREISTKPELVEIHPSGDLHVTVPLGDFDFPESQHTASTAYAEMAYTTQTLPGELGAAISIVEPPSEVVETEFAEHKVPSGADASSLVYSQSDLIDDINELAAISEVLDTGFVVSPELTTTVAFVSDNAADTDVVVEEQQSVFASSNVISEQAVSLEQLPKADSSDLDSYLREVIFDQGASGGADWFETSLVDTVFPEEMVRPLHRRTDVHSLRIDLDSGLEEVDIVPSTLQASPESEQLSQEESVSTEVCCERDVPAISASLLLGNLDLAEGAFKGAVGTVTERATIVKEGPLGSVEMETSYPDWITNAVSTTAPLSSSESLVGQPSIVYGYSGAVESLFVLPRSAQDASCFCISDLSRDGQVVETAYNARFDHGPVEQAVAELSAGPVVRTDGDDADRASLVYGYSNAVEGVCPSARYAASTDSVVSGESLDRLHAVDLLPSATIGDRTDDKFKSSDISREVESGTLHADVMMEESPSIFDQPSVLGRQIPGHLLPDSTVLLQHPLDVIPTDLFPISDHHAVLSPIEGSPITPPRQEVEPDVSQESADGQVSSPESLWSEVSTVRDVSVVPREVTSRSESEPSVKRLGARRLSSDVFAPPESEPITDKPESPTVRIPLSEDYTVSAYPLSTEVCKEKVVSEAFDRSTSTSVESHLYSAFSRSQESLASVTRSVIETEVKESSPASFTCPPEPAESDAQYVYAEGETKTEMKFTERVMGMFGSMFQGLGRKKVAAVEKVEYEQTTQEDSKRTVVVHPESDAASETLPIELLLAMEPDDLVELVPPSSPMGDESVRRMSSSIPSEGVAEQQVDTFVPGDEGPTETELVGDMEGTMITDYKEELQVAERGWVKKTYRVVVEKRKSSTVDVEQAEGADASPLKAEQMFPEEKRLSMEKVLARSPEESAVSQVIESYERQGEEALTSLESRVHSAELSAQISEPERVHLTNLEMPSTQIEHSSEIIQRRFIFRSETQTDSLEDVGMAQVVGSEEQTSISEFEQSPSSDATDQDRPTWAEALFKSRLAADRRDSTEERRYSALMSTESVEYLVDDVLAEAASQVNIEGAHEQPEWFQVTSEKSPMYFERAGSLETFHWSFPSSIDASRQESQVEVVQAERAAEASLFVVLAKGEEQADAVVTIHRPELSPDSLGAAPQPDILCRSVPYLREEAFEHPGDRDLKVEDEERMPQRTLQLTPELMDTTAISEAPSRLVDEMLDKRDELGGYSVDISFVKPLANEVCEEYYFFSRSKESVAEKLDSADLVAQREPISTVLPISEVSEASIQGAEDTRLERIKDLESEFEQTTHSIVEDEFGQDSSGSVVDLFDHKKTETVEHLVHASEKAGCVKVLTEIVPTNTVTATLSQPEDINVTKQAGLGLESPSVTGQPIHDDVKELRSPAEVEGVPTSLHSVSDSAETIDRLKQEPTEHVLSYVGDSGLQMISPIGQALESPVVEGERTTLISRPAMTPEMGIPGDHSIEGLLKGDTGEYALAAGETDMAESGSVLSPFSEHYLPGEDMEKYKLTESCELQGSFSSAETVQQEVLTLYENAYQTVLSEVTTDKEETITSLSSTYGDKPEFEAVSQVPVEELPSFLEADSRTVSFVDSVIRTAQMEIAKIETPYSDEVEVAARIHELRAGYGQESAAREQASRESFEGSSFLDVPAATMKVEPKLEESTEHAYEEPTSIQLEHTLSCDDDLWELPQEVKERFAKGIGSCDDELKQTEVHSLFRREDGCLDIGEMPENEQRAFGFVAPMLSKDEVFQHDRELSTDYDTGLWFSAAESRVDQTQLRGFPADLVTSELAGSLPEVAGLEGTCFPSQVTAAESDRQSEQVEQLTERGLDGTHVTSVEGSFTSRHSNLYHPEVEIGESSQRHWDVREGSEEPLGPNYPEEAALEHIEKLSYEQQKAALVDTPYYPEDQEFVLSKAAPDDELSFGDRSQQQEQESKGMEHVTTALQRDTAIEETMYMFGTMSETGDTSGEATRVSPDNSLSAEYHTPKQSSPTETDSLQGYSVASESDADRLVEMQGYDSWLGEPAGPFLMPLEPEGGMVEGARKSELPFYGSQESVTKLDDDGERLPQDSGLSSVDYVTKLTSSEDHAKGEEKPEEDGSQEDVIAKQKLEFVVERYPAVEVEHVLRYEELEEERFRLVHSGSESFGSDVIVPEMVVADQSSSDAALSSDEVTEVTTSQAVDNQMPYSFDTTYSLEGLDELTVHPLTHEELISVPFEPQEPADKSKCIHSEADESLKPEALLSLDQSRPSMEEKLEPKKLSEAESLITVTTSRDSMETPDMPVASAEELASSADHYDERLSEHVYPVRTLNYEELEAEPFYPDDAVPSGAWLTETVSEPSASPDSECFRKPSMPETYEVSRSGSIFSPAKDQSKMWIHEEETDSLSGLLSAVAPDVERTFERTMDEGQKSAELPQEEMPSEAVLVSDQYSSRLSPDSLREDDEKTSAAAELSGIPSASAEEVQLSSPAVLHYSLDEVTPMWSSEPVTEPKEGYGREPAAERVPKLPEEHAASEETDADWVMVSMMETAPLPSLEEPILSPRLPESTDDQQERDKERQVSDNVLSLSADSLDGGEPTEESPVSEVAVSVRSAEAALEMTSEEENNSPRRRVLKPRVRSKQGSFDNVSDTASLLEFERLEREINLRGGGDSLSSSETELMVSHAKRRCSNGSQSSLAEFERLERELDESTTTGREERAHGQNGDTVDVMLLSDIKEESETEELSSVSGRQTAASFDQHSLSFGDQDDSMQKLDSGMTTPEYVPQDGYHVERIEDQVEPCMVTSIDSLEGELPMEPQTEASSTRMPTISLVSSDSLEMYRERTDADSSVVPEAACAVGGMKFIGDFALSDRDSLIASSTSEMSADDGQETGVVEKSDLVSSDTMASFQEYGDEGERDSLCGDFKTADDEEALSTPVDETRLPFSVGVVGSSSTRVSSSGGMGAGDDFATTITRFETHRALDDGCMEVITRTVSTRVTDPVSTRIRFTGADSAAQSVTTISARPPTYEEFTSTDEMGNVTRTVVRRISAAEVSGLHDLDGSIGIIPMSETGSLGGSRSQARTSQGDVSVERREYRRSYGEIRSSRNHLSDGDYQPRRPTLLRQGDRRSRRRSNGVERKSPDSDGSSDSLDAFNSNA